MTPELSIAIGNVIDRWDQIPNDIRSDPGFEELENALQKLYNIAIREEN